MPLDSQMASEVAPFSPKNHPTCKAFGDVTTPRNEEFCNKKGLMIYIYICMYVNKDCSTKIKVHLQILIAESWEKWELTTEAWI